MKRARRPLIDSRITGPETSTWWLLPEFRRHIEPFSQGEDFVVFGDVTFYGSIALNHVTYNVHALAYLLPRVSVMAEGLGRLRQTCKLRGANLPNSGVMRIEFEASANRRIGRLENALCLRGMPAF